MRRVSLPRLIAVFTWTGLSSLGGGRSAYFHDALVRRRDFVRHDEFVQDFTHHWQQWRTRLWAARAERALIPVGIGLMAGGVYTLARTAIHDGVTAALAVATDREPISLSPLGRGQGEGVR